LHRDYFKMDMEKLFNGNSNLTVWEIVIDNTWFPFEDPSTLQDHLDLQQMATVTYYLSETYFISMITLVVLCAVALGCLGLLIYLY